MEEESGADEELIDWGNVGEGLCLFGGGRSLRVYVQTVLERAGIQVYKEERQSAREVCEKKRGVVLWLSCCGGAGV